MSTNTTLEIEILRRILDLLRTDQVTYICTPLKPAIVAHQSQEYLQACASLDRWIKSMLAPHQFLENWLITHNHVAFQDFNKFTDLTTDYPARLRATRIAWVEWMISQISLSLQ